MGPVAGALVEDGDIAAATVAAAMAPRQSAAERRRARANAGVVANIVHAYRDALDREQGSAIFNTSIILI